MQRGRSRRSDLADVLDTAAMRLAVADAGCQRREGCERRLASSYRAQTPGLVRDLAEGLVLWLAFQL